MASRGLVKCSRLIFIFFLMCPKRSRLSSPSDKNQILNEKNTGENDVDNGTDVPKFKKNIEKMFEEDSLNNIHDEPGFDLNDDEITKLKLWRNGIIYYMIDTVSYSDKVLRDRIRSFLNTVNDLTRISFMELPFPPRKEEVRWVFFVNRRGQLGCGDHSILNMTHMGVQPVILGYDCMSTNGELAEAVLAIAGVPPQHNAPDRDEYIKINEENIMPEKKYLFKKLKPEEWLFHDIKYDFASAGHFHHHKHSVNGRATIEFLEPHSNEALHMKRDISIGESNGFTATDILKMRMIYNFIVKKKENEAPDCKKLFRKGPRFNDSKPSFPSPEPRKKPNKYLGLPEDAPDTSMKDKKEVEKESSSNSVSDFKSSTEYEDEDLDYNGNKLKDKEYSKGNEGVEPQMKVKVAKKRNRKYDALAHYSDFQTDYDVLRKRRSGNKTV